jgi:hypothetical protein
LNRTEIYRLRLGSQIDRRLTGSAANYGYGGNQECVSPHAQQLAAAYGKTGLKQPLGEKHECFELICYQQVTRNADFSQTLVTGVKPFENAGPGQPSRSSTIGAVTA